MWIVQSFVYLKSGDDKKSINMNIISLTDQTVSGASINTFDISVDSEEITLREIISARVTYEVGLYNSKTKKPYSGLVTPSATEVTLNKIPSTGRIVDAEEQTYVALDGFLKNSFFVFVNDKQVADLDSKFNVKDIQEVGFIKLTPLVGG